MDIRSYLATAVGIATAWPSFNLALAENMSIDYCLNQSMMCGWAARPTFSAAGSVGESFQAARSNVRKGAKVNSIRWAWVLLLLVANGASADYMVGAGAIQTLSAGALDLGCTGLAVAGNMGIETGRVRQAQSVTIAASGVLDGGAGDIQVGGDWNNSGIFVPGTSVVTISNACGAAEVRLSGQTVFNDLTLTSTSGARFVLPAGHNITVNGTLTLQGGPGQPIQLVSSSGQTAYVALGPGARLVTANATVQPGVQIGEAASGMQGIPSLGAVATLILAMLLGAITISQSRVERVRRGCHPTRKHDHGDFRNEP